MSTYPAETISSARPVSGPSGRWPRADGQDALLPFSEQTLWLQIGVEAPSRARDHVAAVLGSWGIDADCIGDAVVLVSEIVSNVVEHTAVRSVGVDVGATERRVVVGVRESGVTAIPGPDTHMLTDFDPAPRPRPTDIRGRGLKILDALAAEWGISRAHRCTSTWFTLAPAVAPPVQIVSPSAAAELDALQASLRRTQMLLRITEHLGAAVTAEQVGEVITRHLREHLDAMFTGIALFEPDDVDGHRTMRYLDLSVFPQATRDRWARFPLDVDVPVAAAALTRTGSYLGHPDEAEAEFPGIAAHMAISGTGAIAHLPLIAGGRCLGTLALAWREPRDIDADTRALLTIVAGYTAHALYRRAADHLGAAPELSSETTVTRAEARVADARAEFDAAVADGVSLVGLAGREQEIRRADAALEAAWHGAAR